MDQVSQENKLQLSRIGMFMPVYLLCPHIPYVASLEVAKVTKVTVYNKYVSSLWHATYMVHHSLFLNNVTLVLAIS